jgi:hypothetical protein
MQFQEIVILVPRRRCLLIDQLLSQAFCLIVFGSFLALRLSFFLASPFYVPQYTNSKTSLGRIKKYSEGK